MVAVFAHSFYKEDPNAVCKIDNGSGDVKEMVCGEIGLSDAAGALHAHLGESARYVWGIGLLGKLLLK